ncbi:Phage protein [plant metagenome]|uniref:Phage protein n=1 Tax=plant metagenome TaxID=1297885 RepID=A0A484TEY9_9ZZZZ
MPYILPLDLAKRPGARELAQVATREDAPIVDDALMEATLRGQDRAAWSAEQLAAADDALERIVDATVEASSVIDGMVGKRYPLPLVNSPLVTGWARSIARYLLHKGRTSMDKDSVIVRDYDNAMRLLGMVADGRMNLGEPAPGVPVSTDVRFGGDAPVFSRRQLRAFR